MIELNEKQRQPAEFTFGTASVIATPGSGKTFTMATRIGNLVRSDRIANIYTHLPRKEAATEYLKRCLVILSNRNHKIYNLAAPLRVSDFWINQIPCPLLPKC